MIGKINGKEVSSAKGIKDGTERAVSNEERLNMLLEQARQMFQDISPNNWTPTKLACAEIDKLRDERHALRLEVEFYDRERKRQTSDISALHTEWVAQQHEIDRLKRPLWVKIVGWFAR